MRHWSTWKAVLFLSAVLSMSYACLPKKIKDDSGPMFSVNSTVNKNAKNRSQKCLESGGTWSKDKCQRNSYTSLSSAQCQTKDQYVWDQILGACLHLSQKSEAELCRQEGKSYDLKSSKCIRKIVESNDCQSQNSSLVWDGDRCVNKSEPENFYRMCLRQDLNPDDEHTINQIKKQYMMSRCEDIWKKLSGQKILYLQNKSIISLNPLRDLEKLESLILGGNQIEDISVISTMKNLNYLDLHSNKVMNLEPVRENLKLETLYLNDNNIDSIAPLKNLLIKEIQLENTPLHNSERNDQNCPREAQAEVIRRYCSGLL